MVVDDGGFAKGVITQRSPGQVVHNILNAVVVFGMEIQLVQLLRDFVLVAVSYTHLTLPTITKV